MDTVTFMRWYTDRKLREHVWQLVTRRSHRDEVREDLWQEAWLVVSCLDDHVDYDCCKQMATRAVRAGYWQENKERLVAHG